MLESHKIPEFFHLTRRNIFRISNTKTLRGIVSWVEVIWFLLSGASCAVRLCPNSFASLRWVWAEFSLVHIRIHVYFYQQFFFSVSSGPPDLTLICWLSDLSIWSYFIDPQIPCLESAPNIWICPTTIRKQTPSGQETTCHSIIFEPLKVETVCCCCRFWNSSWCSLDSWWVKADVPCVQRQNYKT